jgi:hypothetical protein
VTMRIEECPRRDEHTPCPASYVGWHVWAEQMSLEGYDSVRHVGACNLYTQWVTKTGRPVRVGIDNVWNRAQRRIDREQRAMH